MSGTARERPLTTEGRPRRPIRSFVRREGRITPGQAHALAEHWSEFGLKPGGRPIDWAEVFGRRAPVACEIGFGDGRAQLEMARNEPERDFLGVEVYRPGVGALLARLKESGLSNVRVAMMDAVELLRDGVPPESLNRLMIFFPDPWPIRRCRRQRAPSLAHTRRVRCHRHLRSVDAERVHGHLVGWFLISVATI